MDRDMASFAALRERIATADAVVAFFTEPTCRVGAAVEQKALEMVAEEFPRIELLRVDTVAVPEAAGQLEVLTLPTLIVFFAGRETARFVRTFGIDEVRRALERPYAIMFS